MSLSEENAHYRRLAEYDQLVWPQYVKLKNVPLEYLRGLVLKYQQQKQATYLDTRLRNQTRPKYYQTCGHLTPSFTLKQHTGYSIRCYMRPASYWAPVTRQALLEEEKRWHYNNHWLRPIKLTDKRNGQLTQLWGREEMETNWQQQGDIRVFLGEQLKGVARFLRDNENLKILLQARAPRLMKLSSDRKLLGYVAYFLDCCQRFHDYEQTIPVVRALANTRAAPPVLMGADRWAGILVDYTLADLNNLLVFVGLLETAQPLVVAAGTKPAQWLAIAAALRKGKRTRADKAALHRAFFDTYGTAVGSLSSFSREYNESNEAAQRCYSRALSRLG